MNVTHEGQTRVVRECCHCAELGLYTLAFELDRFPGIAIIEFRCEHPQLKHLMFEALPPVPRPTHVQEHAA